MKGTEKNAAKALERQLKILDLDVSWEPVTPDPPDFLFKVGSERWAVEATELHQYIDNNGEETSRLGVEKSLERMCEQIQAQAHPRVNKKYLIFASGPVNTSLVEIQNRALAYIKSGKTEREALDAEAIDEPNPEIAAIKRRGAEHQAHVFIEAQTTPVPIVYGIGLGGATLGADQENLAADLEATLRYAVDRMLQHKLPKLATLGGYDRRILLVWRGYLFAEPRNMKTLLAEKNLSKADLLNPAK